MRVTFLHCVPDVVIDSTFYSRDFDSQRKASSSWEDFAPPGLIGIVQQLLDMREGQAGPACLCSQVKLTSVSFPLFISLVILLAPGKTSGQIAAFILKDPLSLDYLLDFWHEHSSRLP